MAENETMEDELPEVLEAAERDASAFEAIRKDLERAEALIERYRQPLPDGGHSVRERLHVAKVRMDDAEANLKDETDRRESAEALLKDYWAAVVTLRYYCKSALETLDGYPFGDPARANRAAASELHAALSALDEGGRPVTGPPAYGVSGVCTGDYLRQFRELEAEIERLRARSRGLDLTDEEMARVKVPHRHWCARSERPAAACDCGAAGLMGRVREALSASPGSEERCGRLLVGQGTDTYDPLCQLPEGHSGRCSPGSGRGENDGGKGAATAACHSGPSTDAVVVASETDPDLGVCRFCERPATRIYAGVPICAEPSECRARLGPPDPPPDRPPSFADEHGDFEGNFS